MRIHDVVLAVHVPVALACVPAWWVPLLVRKGGRAHVLVGRAFVAGIIWVALTGMVMGALRLLAPEELAPGADAAALARLRASGPFFLYLGTITLAPTIHGWRVVRTRRAPEALRSVFDVGVLALAVLGSVGAVLCGLLLPGAPTVLLLSMSPIGIGVGLAGLAYVRAPRSHPTGWWIAHRAQMIGAGIAVHTAFGVFVVSRWIAPGLAGWWQLLPWLLPSAIGVPAILLSLRAAARHVDREGSARRGFGRGERGGPE